MFTMVVLLVAATMQGIISLTARDQVKRRVAGRSVGISTLLDKDFYRDVSMAADKLADGEYENALRNIQPLAVGAASAMPYIGDIALMGLSQLGMGHSRGHLLDFSNRSLVLQFVTQALVGVGGVALSAGQRKDAFLQIGEDFTYRWLPYTDVVLHKGLGLHGGAREKFMNSLALGREAVLSGIVEPRSYYGGARVARDAVTVIKRRISNAASERDPVEVRDAFKDLVEYYQTKGREKLSRSDARRRAINSVERLSPMNRAVQHRRVSRRESRAIRARVTGGRAGRINEALADYLWLAKLLRARPEPEISRR